MSLEVIKYAFVAGEVSPTLFGRTDLEKYDLGLAEARNWFVDYRGGLSTRPGTQFCDYVLHDHLPTKYVAFKFAPNLPNTYVILFGDEYIRFIQDGAYVLEGNKTITDITNALHGVVTSAAHGYSNGDWVYISGVVGMTEVNGQLYQISNVGANSFRLNTPFGADAVAVSTLNFGVYASGGVANRVYTLASPYQAEDLADLRAYQRRDLVRLTHNGYLIRNLTRTAHANWTLSTETIGNTGSRPTNLAASKSATVAAGAENSASVGFVVTAVVDGKESQPSNMLIVDDCINYTVVRGSVTITWTKVTGASHYNVYRTNVLTSKDAATEVTLAEQVGFLGRCYGPTFTDSNIIPNFTITPPQFRNPFANSTITHIEVTNGGTGYAKTATVAVVGAPGSGFFGFPVVDDSGVIISVVVVNGGDGYVAPVVSFTGGGSSATATASVGPATGNNPAVSSIFQQRVIYAATLNQPLTLWGTIPGQFSNFDESAVVADSDAFEFDIESEEVSPIRHLIAMRGGLLLMSQSGVYQLHGSAQNESVTPTNALADPQSYRGCSNVPPLGIDTDLLYIEGKGLTVRLLNYNDIAKVYAGQNMSILSNHLFKADNQIVAWGYAQNPFNVVYAAREDGAFLVFTLVKEQDVYAWTPCYTKGLVTDVVVVQEGNVDSIYLMVKRFINGRWTKHIERVAQREISNVEDAWCVDCALEYPQTYPDATLTPSAAEGSGVTFTASAAVFAGSATDVGRVIRGGGGKAVVTNFNSTTVVICNIEREITRVVQEDVLKRPVPLLSGEWSIATPTLTVGGLGHLEGEMVTGLADGNVISPRQVVDAEITLDASASKIIVGQGFVSRARTLSPVVGDVAIEAKKKKILGVAVRMNDTRGLKAGSTLSKLYEMAERTVQPWGAPIELRSGQEWILTQGTWDKDGQSYFVQEHPLPATILGLVSDVDVGDDNSQ